MSSDRPESGAALLLIILLAVGCGVPGEAPAVPEPIQNLLFIMGDDHSTGVFGAYGNTLIRTPGLDRLAAQGARFERAYVNSPFCTPSRQSLITGKLPHATGVTLLPTPLGEDQTTIAEHLEGFGFRTGAVGKMHFNSRLRHGFEYRVDRGHYREWLETMDPPQLGETTLVRPSLKPFRNPTRIWLNAEVLPGSQIDERSEGTYFAEKAIEFLRTRSEKRFCLWLSFAEPHSPFNFPIEYSGKYNPADMTTPEVGPDDEARVPAVFRDLSEQDKKGIIASYYTSVEYLDKNVGLVLEELDRLGLSGKTLVIYVGDHGYLLGHHSRFEKHTMWEEEVRAPLLVRGPGIVPAVNQAMVEFVDLVPTILELLSIPSLPGVQGMSFAEVLRGQAKEHRQSLFAEYLPDNQAMLRTHRWKYIFTSGQHDLALGYATGTPPTGIEHRLYDMVADPREFTNLADRPELTETLRSLQGQLLDRFKHTDPRAGRLPSDLDISQALAWFCEPPEEPE